MSERVAWKARPWSEGSSAIISREMVLALDRAGVDVSVVNLDPSVTDCRLLHDRERDARLRALVSASPDRSGRVAVRCAAPEPDETGLIEGVWDVAPEVSANVAFLTLPYGFLPEGAEPATGNALLDQVWGCSDYVSGTLVELGFDPAKVRTVPLGYAPDVFNPAVEPAELPTRRRFRFIHVSIPFFLYKGIDVLVRAYVEEFTERDDTCLILQSRRGEHRRREFRELIGREMARAGHRPDVLLLPGGVDQATLAGWYRASSCYVQTSRAEGFGMPVLEAMACGVPVIAVAYGGHLEMCSDQTGMLVDYTVGPPPAGVADEGLLSIRRWAEPDLGHLRHCMRYAYQRQAETRERGAAAAAAAPRFTWDRAAERAITALRELRAPASPGAAGGRGGAPRRP